LKNKRNLAITTEGEYYAILGHSGALGFSGPQTGVSPSCPPEPCQEGKAGIHNILARIGVMEEGSWKAQLEGGWSSGDDDLLSFGEKPDNIKLTSRGFNTNVKVGLLMYQVALKALTFQQLAPFGAAEIGANGSVWNSQYLMPSFRFTIVPGLEVHSQVLVGWASALDPLVYGAGNQDAHCGFSSNCFLGWEADLAIRARMGAKDIVWIDLESGMMQPKDAFTNAGFNDAWLWTVQMRAAMIF
ncbi:MAG: hypothetical protein WCE62_08235, partial [Polyangiales bacterium]